MTLKQGYATSTDVTRTPKTWVEALQTDDFSADNKIQVNATLRSKSAKIKYNAIT